MRKLRFTIIAVFSIMFITYGIKTYYNFYSTKEVKKEERDRLKKSAEILNKCFDLKNKSKRTINESMELIEYCLNNYGTEK